VAVRRSRALLGRAARELDGSQEMRVAIGEPAERLLALAEREAAELLVVAAPDRSRATTGRLGSVYLALASAASCPVVVVPPGVETIAAIGPIVCGVDGSAPSMAAARVAANLAGRLETRLLLLHVVDALSTADRDPERATRGGMAARLLREAAGELRETTPSSLRIEHGAPAERLAAVAEREAAQLLAIGSRGGGRVASVLLASVASRLATSATRPLLDVPPCAERPGAAARTGVHPAVV
jgi:nucleotide-binding universal stress UspA family protein